MPPVKKSMNCLRRHPLFSLLIASFLLVAAIIPQLDSSLTLYANHNAAPLLRDFYSRTLFEGDLPGSGDFIVLGLIIALLGYFRCCLGPPTRRSIAWRPALGFAVFAGLTSAVTFVHTSKWAIGRARPSEVFRHHLAYSDWFSFGSHFISEGRYRGSFPSGHTIEALLPILLAYALAGNPAHSSRTRALGLLCGIFAILNAFTMAVARSMALSHWLSDGLLGLLAAWILIHISYFWILRVPEQDKLSREASLQPSLPACWELLLGLWTMGLGCGIMLILLGIHALLRHENFTYSLLIPAGVCGGYFCLRQSCRLYGKFRARIAYPL